MEASYLKKKVIAVIAAVAAACSMGAGMATTANAATQNISGYLNRSGSLVQYAKVRTKASTGSIVINVTNMPSGYLRLGLRNMKKPGGPQFGPTRQWNRKGTKGWDGVLGGTRFALQGRMKANAGKDNYWAGSIYY